MEKEKKGNKEKKIFDSFVDKYALSKTLRFELVPTEKTKKLLKDNNIFEKDEKIEQAYQEIKPLFDQLHREFVTEALAHKKVDTKIFSKFASDYSNLITSSKKDWKALREVKTKIYKYVVELLNNAGNEWKIRYGKMEGKKKNAFKANGYKILTDAHILKILKNKYPDKKELINTFDKFFTYFSGFNENRENFYKGDGTSTAIATRIVDNLIPFLDNIADFKKYYKPHLNEFSLKSGERLWFEINTYACVLLQPDVDKYNDAIGELNRCMKMLRDEHQKEDGFKKSNYPLLRMLKNQILGEREKKLLFEQIKDEKDAQERLADIVKIASERFDVLKGLFDKLGNGSFAPEDASGIYLNNRAINTISRRFLNDAFSFEKELPQRGSKKDAENPKVAYFVSLAEVREALEKQELEFVFKDENSENKIAREVRLAHLLSLINEEFQGREGLFTTRKQGNEIVIGFDDARSQIQEVMDKNVREKKNREIIKAYFSIGMPVFQMGKYFSLNVNDKKGAEKPINTNAEFYNTYEEYTKDFNFAKQFDLFRNYINKKPGDDENKIKLNFGKGNLLGGWAESPTGNAQFQGYILRKNRDYYLGITTDSHFLDIEKYPEELCPKKGGDVYEKLEYFQLDWGKNIVGGQVYTSYTKQKLGEKLSFQEHKAKVKNQKEHVAFIKTLIREKYLERYSFLVEFLAQEFVTPKDMQAAFTKLQTSGMKFVNVRAERIERQLFNRSGNKESLLYLYKISNKDLRNHKDVGSKNIHSHYWNTLFSDENLKKDMRIKLLGGAEVFLRRGKIEELKEREVKNRKIWKGAVLEHRRYAEDKQFFHVSIQLNAQASNPPSRKSFNKEINAVLSAHPGMCVVGIDRGEKHLLYYSVINSNGEILEQGSMNELEVAGKKINFYAKLVELEKERIKNRRSWEPVRGIKDLKKGYVSHAIHKVIQLMDAHQAIIVLEDLNMRFKQVRGGVERSVYQQFEKALIDKLGYLVFKDYDPNIPGGIKYGYQLAAPFKSFEKLGKQTGILFYTQADYTSITDPVTGFRKNVYISNSASVKEIARIFTEEKIKVDWDEKEQSYTFTYDQADFIKDKKNPVSSKLWTVYANVPRIRRSKESGYWQYKLVSPNDLLEMLFETWDIPNPHNGLRDKFAETDNLSENKEFEGKKRNFWQTLIFVFNLILQVRNSSSQRLVKNDKGEWETLGEEIDFIASPIKPFFQTSFVWGGKQYNADADILKGRIVGKNKDEIIRSYNGDANGAYNIARKGKIILGRIHENPEIEEKNLFIRKEEWDQFTQNQWNHTSKSQK